MEHQTNKVWLYIITGVAGSGKSTIVDCLRQKDLPSYCIYDFDTILRPYDGSSEWQIDVMDRLLDVFLENRDENIITVVGGLIRLGLFKERLIKRQISVVANCCLLKVSPEERNNRLVSRGASQELIDDLDNYTELPAGLAQSAFPFISIDTTNKTPDEIVDLLIHWLN